MSHKAFYQTFFQTEQLFRRSDDALTFPALENVVANRHEPASTSTPGRLPKEESVAAPSVQISDPVVPPPVEATPVLIEEIVATVAIIEPTSTADETPKPTPEPVIVAPVQPPQIPTAVKPATPLISQKVLILVDEDLLPSDLLFLEKILKAVHLDVDGVDLLNVHGTKNVDFAELLTGKYIHHFFTFGVPFSRLNLDIMMDRYHPVRFEGITFLMADPLPAIEADVALKKKLWESLKKVFLWR
ncbi:hypothetical protein [uncultured Fibrella sp.]|uniref:hypothetical protein n=1 Tax=uncultured Fibrella sp. TaxID=1284596 RepID=UPI0035CCA6BF